MSILLQNFSPESGTQYVSPAFTVSFTITGDSDPIDLSSLNVYLSETDFSDPVISSGNAQDGYNVSILQAENGYDVSFTASRLHRGESVAVYISADTTPSSGVQTFTRYFYTTNHIGYIFTGFNPLYGVSEVTSSDEDYSGITLSGRRYNILFQLNDASEPVITNRIPVPNSTGVDRTTSVQFSLHDQGQEGVDITSLEIYVNGNLAFDNGGFAPPYTGTVQTTVIDGFEGYTVTVTPPEYFDYSSSPTIRVVVSDATADPAARNTLDTTYQFTIEDYVDVEGPSADLTLPDTGLALDGCIEFDWLDAPFGEGPNFSTLNVTLRRELTIECITAISDSIAVVNGVAAPGYTLYAWSITVGNQVGYHVVICPTVPFNELETITVIINGEDSQQNSQTTTFNISTQEITPPEIVNLNPSPESTGIDHETSISFDMHDSGGTGVDPSRLIVKIDDGEAVISGVAQTGYSLTSSSGLVTDGLFQYDGYSFSVSRDLPFDPGKQIAVEIDGYDAYGNLATEVYYFTTAADVTPPSIELNPPHGSEGIARDTFITVTIRDTFGVQRDSIDIKVQNETAVLSGQGVLPFDVYVSETELVPGIADGYQFIIDREFDFSFNEDVYVWVSATDLNGNNVSHNMMFTTFDDEVAPSVTYMAPRNGQKEVSLRPTIEFTIQDGYDVDLYRTNVSINGEPAIVDGKAWHNYYLTTYRIIDGYEEGVEPGDGYGFLLFPQYDFDYNETVEVAVMAFDVSRGNRLYETYSWDTIRPAPPKYDMLPYAYQNNVDVDTNIWFEIFEDGYEIDIDTLNLAMDGVKLIEDGIIQSPDYEGNIISLDGYRHYTGTVNPRFLLTPNTRHTLSIRAAERLSGNFSELGYYFETSAAPNNPKTIYLGDSNGVKSVEVEDISEVSSATSLIDGYYVNDISSKELKYINYLGVATRDSGAFLYVTNYSKDPLFYSVGDEISKINITSNHNGTIYLANKTRERVDVYYNILYDNVGRSTPDVYYGIDGYVLSGLLDGYFNDMVVTEGTSIVNSDSNSIFLGTPSGAFRIETDESDPGSTEINGRIISYGISNSNRDYSILSGTTNYVVALDVNVRLNYLYVATRSEDYNDKNAVSYIDLSSNSADGDIDENRLIHRLINDISFKDP